MPFKIKPVGYAHYWFHCKILKRRQQQLSLSKFGLNEKSLRKQYPEWSIIQQSYPKSLHDLIFNHLTVAFPKLKMPVYVYVFFYLQASQSVFLTVFCSNNIPIHPTSSDRAELMLETNYGNHLLKVGYMILRF